MSDDDATRKSKSRSLTKAKKDREPSVVEDSEPASGGDGEDDEDDEEEEEYEIEAVLDAKKGHFPKVPASRPPPPATRNPPQNKLGYFVKWKNHSDEHNSWVTEEDAGYVRSPQPLARSTRRSETRRSSSTSTGSCKSARMPPRRSTRRPSARAASLSPWKTPLSQRCGIGGVRGSDASDSASAPVTGKKRKGPQKARARADDDEDEGPPAKKARLASKKNADNQEPGAVPADEYIKDMSEHMHAPTWDQLVAKIDTVEKGSDGKLYVYFTLCVTCATRRVASRARLQEKW